MGAIKSKDRITSAALKKQRNRVLSIIPAYKRDGVPEDIISICNTYVAMSTVARNNKMYVDYVRLALWLYQFKFFEKKYVVEKYKIISDKDHECDIRHAKLCFNELERKEYIELYKHRSVKYSEDERREGYVVSEEIVSDSVYRLSFKGEILVEEFFKEMDLARPNPWYGDGENVMAWRSQGRDDLNNYSKF